MLKNFNDIIIKFLILELKTEKGLNFIRMSDGTRVEGNHNIIKLVEDIFCEKIDITIIYKAIIKRDEQINEREDT